MATTITAGTDTFILITCALQVIVRTQTLGGAVKAAQTVLANYTRGYKNLKPGTQEQKDEDARARKGSWVALTCAVVISTNEDTLKTMSEVPKPSTIERWRSWWQKLRSGRRKEPSAAAPVQDNGVGSSVVPRDVSGGSVTQEPDEIVSDEGEARVPAPAGTPGSQSVSIELPGMTYTSESITYVMDAVKVVQEVQDPTGPEADARIVISKSTTAIKQPSRTPGADSVQHRTADGTASGTDEVIGQDSESLHTFQVSFILPRKLQPENAPVPLPGSGVTIRDQQLTYVAAYRWSSHHPDEYELYGKLKKLLEMLREDGLEADTSHVALFQYWHRWAPGFIRSNEMIVPLKNYRPPIKPGSTHIPDSDV